MLISGVMDDLADALAGIDGLRVFPYWADRITPPAAVVAWPDPLTYDVTMGRGSDELEIPVIVLVGKVDSRTSRDAIAAYADGSGDASVKAAIEAHAATSYDVATVTRAEFGFISVGGTEYLAATFTVAITGPGS